MPGMLYSTLVRSVTNGGIASNSACVYGCRMLANSGPVSLDSTIWPAYITITRSARPAMTPRSCVISSMLMCSSSLSRSSSVRICPWIVTSSAVVGSSAMSNCGSQTRAVAMTTRWRRPPDS